MTQRLTLPDVGRGMGTRILAGPGAGKSKLIGETIAWGDWTRNHPVILLDPMGKSIDFWLGKFLRVPEQARRALWGRVRYIDMSGKTAARVVPFPLFYQRADESLYVQAQRWLDCVHATDPQLSSAPIQGWNAVLRLGRSMGMLLAGTGNQITEAEDLLSHPKAWLERTEGLPRLRRARVRLARYASKKPQEQQADALTLVTKIDLFTLDETNAALFGASTPGLDWAEVIAKRQIVLVDFRHEEDEELRKFKVLWVYRSLLGALQYLPRSEPVSLIIDEISFLLNDASMRGDLLAVELEKLVSVYARNLKIWVTLAHQSMTQVSRQVEATLMSMGNQILGGSANLDEAIQIARRFFPFDPTWIKRLEAVYGSFGTRLQDRETIFPIAEQNEMRAQEVLGLRTYHFLVGVSEREGTRPTSLARVTTEFDDPDAWPHPESVANARHVLMLRDGRKVSDVLAEIEARRQPPAITAGKPTATPAQSTTSPTPTVVADQPVAPTQLPLGGLPPPRRPR